MTRVKARAGAPVLGVLHHRLGGGGALHQNRLFGFRLRLQLVRAREGQRRATAGRWTTRWIGSFATAVSTPRMTGRTTPPRPLRLVRQDVPPRRSADRLELTDVPPEDEDALEKAEAMQPVSVAIEADHRSFQLYAGGVYAADDCRFPRSWTTACWLSATASTGLAGHKHFWKAKNSWAPWEDGFIRIAKGGKWPGRPARASIRARVPRARRTMLGARALVSNDLVGRARTSRTGDRTATQPTSPEISTHGGSVERADRALDLRLASSSSRS